MTGTTTKIEGYDDAARAVRRSANRIAAGGCAPAAGSVGRRAAGWLHACEMRWRSSLLDKSLFDTVMGNRKVSHLRASTRPFREGVQMGQVAIYCRVSTDDQCCERQERDLKAFAKRGKHTIV